MSKVRVILKQIEVQKLRVKFSETDIVISSFIYICQSCLCSYIVDLMLLIYLHAGIVINVLIILIIMLCIHIIWERRKHIKVKEQNFRQHGGWLPLKEIRKLQGFAFKTFTEEELEQATNKFHKNNILRHGAYGIVYKGILTIRTLGIWKLF